MDWRADIRNEFARLGKHGDDDVIEELAQHAEAAWASERAEGASPDHADAAVRELIGAWCAGTTGVPRIHRAPLLESAPAGGSSFAGLGLDLRHAWRLLTRQPGFAFVSIVMIALGIGATTTIFSVVNGVLLKPLPWTDAGRLVQLFETREGSTRSVPLFTNATYLTWKPSPATIEDIGGWSNDSFSLAGSSGAERVRGADITANLFPLLGATPFLGAGFAPEDEAAATKVLLSYGFWRERFGGATDVVGRGLTLGTTAYTIAGVMPDGFEFPTSEARLWIPMAVVPALDAKTGAQTVSMFNAVARLKPGATLAQAASEGTARGRSGPGIGMVTQAVFGSNGAVIVTATPMLDAIAGDVKPALWVLFVAVVLLMGTALANVANMQMAHAAVRRREVAIRTAIGAGAARIARQQLVETAILAVSGSLLGIALTAAALRALPSLLPADFPRAASIALDGRVLAMAIVLTLVATLAIALLPVRLSRRVRLTDALGDDGSAPVGQGLRSPVARSRAFIIAGQVAIASILLVGAALLSRSFVALLNTDRGYRTENVLTARLSTDDLNLPPAANAAVFAQVVERLSALPGVTRVGQTNSLPLTNTDAMMGFQIADPQGGPPANANALLRVVSPGYFSALGMRIGQGRGFSATDTLTSDPVVLANQTFAQKYLGASPLNAPVPLQLDKTHKERTPWRVVGIVDDIRHTSATGTVQPELYVSSAQLGQGPSTLQYLVVKTTGNPTWLVSDLRAIVRDAGAGIVMDQVSSMEARLMTSLSKPRLYAVLLGGFGVFALLIAGIGLFGGLSYAVSQRTREIGVRTALGATPWSIVRLVVSQGAAMTAAGLAVGLTAAAFATRVLSQFLYGVDAHDAASYAGVALVLVVIAAAACALPARRAASIDPLRGLRS